MSFAGNPGKLCSCCPFSLTAQQSTRTGSNWCGFFVGQISEHHESDAKKENPLLKRKDLVFTNLLNKSLMSHCAYTFNSHAELLESVHVIANAVRLGREVCVGMVRHVEKYAMFNVKRWNMVERYEYTSLFENNGLPTNWAKTLAAIADTTADEEREFQQACLDEECGEK